MKAASVADRRNAFGAVPFMQWLGVRREWSEAGRARRRGRVVARALGPFRFLPYP